MAVDEAGSERRPLGVLVSGVGGFALAGVLHHGLVVGVAALAASREGEYALEGILGRVGGDGYEVDGRAQTHRVLGGLGEGVVNLAVGYLVVDAVCPVVLGDVAVLRVHVAVHVELAPYVPHLVPFVGR